MMTRSALAPFVDMLMVLIFSRFFRAAQDGTGNPELQGKVVESPEGPGVVPIRPSGADKKKERDDGGGGERGHGEPLPERLEVDGLGPGASAGHPIAPHFCFSNPKIGEISLLASDRRPNWWMSDEGGGIGTYRRRRPDP
jgi:hypothetical protein